MAHPPQASLASMSTGPSFWTSSLWISALLAGLSLNSLWCQAGDWSRFRGPNGTGVSPDSTPTPVVWSPTQNIKWRVELPGEGVSCPIVVGDKIFVTAYSGYGYTRGEQKDLKRHLVCLDRATGKTLWQTSVEPVLPEDPYSGAGVPQHGYASHTPVSDGERVYVFFGKTGVMAFDLDGKQLWKHGVGTESDPRRWGSSSSPILVEGVVVVPAGPESRALIGLDAKTGEELWKSEGESLGNLWGTPAVASVANPQPGAPTSEIILGAPGEIWGVNPRNGKLRWYAEAVGGDQFSTSVVVDNGVVYAVEGRSGGSIALKAGGKGDVTATNVVWKGRDANRFGTPVVYNNRLYFVSNGIVNCLDAKTGNKLFQSRLPVADSSSANRPIDPPREAPREEGGRGGRGGFGGGGGGRGGTDYASPVAADGKIYFVTNTGDTHVFKASDTFESLAVNQTATGETFAATPAISNGELFLRSNKALYCISDKQ